MFYEGITVCERCCNDCTQVCPKRCENCKKSCGGYLGKVRYWGNWEEKRLSSMKYQGLAWAELSAGLCRSEASCKQKYRQIKRKKYLS